MNKTIHTLGFLLSIFMGLSACTSVGMREGPTPGINVRGPDFPNAGIRMNSVAIIDKSLQSLEKGKIAVETTTSRRTATGTLEAVAVLRNRTDYPLQVEGRVQFFDAQKIPVDGPTAWQRVYLNPNGVETYRDYSSKVQDIKHYYIELREGR